MVSAQHIKPRRRTSPAKVIFYIFLTLLSLVGLYPIYFCVVSSLKESLEIFSNPFSLPLKPVFYNYVDAFIEGNIGRYFVNTVILTICTLAVTGLIGSMASYILARFIFRGKNALFLFFIAGLMIPMQAVIIPIAYAFGKLRLYDNYPAIILVFTAFCLPMTVLILTGFIKAIPVELEEAAIIDGSNAFRVYQVIIVPLGMPAIASVSIFNFIQVWNNLLFPLVLIKSPNWMTISYGLLNFFADKTSDYGGVMAAGVITMVPVMVAYILFQEKVEKSLVAGAVKG